MKNYKIPTLILTIILIIIGCRVEVQIDDFNNDDENGQNTNYYPINLNVPSNGLLGEYIKIAGQNFVIDSLKFTFNNIETTAYQNSNDTINVRVPRDLDIYNPDFYIYTKSMDSLIHKSPFQLREPTISHPEKINVKFGEYIWIYGNNFDNQYDYLKVFLNDEEIQLGTITHDSLQVFIPNNLSQKNLSFKINAQLQEVQANNLMSLVQPDFLPIATSINVGDLLTLIGDNFNLDENFSEVTINDEIDARIDYIYNTDSLRIRIPYGPYDEFKINKISYNTAGMQSIYNNPLTISSSYVLHFKNHPLFLMSDVYEYNNKLYAIGSENDSSDSPPDVFLWELDYNLKTWEKISSINFPAYGVSETMTSDGEIYVYTNSSADGFLKIDLSSLSMTQLINIPDDNNRSSPTVFSANNTIYLGKGKNPSTNTFYTDLYAYDIATNSWTSVATDSNTFYGNRSFDYLNNKYISTYEIGSGISYDLFTFDESTNFFTQAPLFSIGSGTFFPFNNSIIKVNSLPSPHTDYFYDLISNELKTTMVSYLQGTSHFFSYQGKVFFYSSVFNDTYYPSEGFYIVNESITSQL